MKPRICVSIASVSNKELLSKVIKAQDMGADLIEIRFDFLDNDLLYDLNLARELVKTSSVPLIATNRKYSQGGYSFKNEKFRIQTLINAAKIGFEYVDLETTSSELISNVEILKSCGAKPIISFHDLKGTPLVGEMEKIVRSQIRSGAFICKLVTTANNVEDNINCLLLTRKISLTTKFVCFTMGMKGLISRVFSPLFGGYFTFASIQKGLETASGQLSIAEMRELYTRLGVEE